AEIEPPRRCDRRGPRTGESCPHSEFFQGTPRGITSDESAFNSIGGARGLTALAGCGKTILPRENFDGPHVSYNGRTARRMLEKARLLTRPTLAVISPAHPESAKTDFSLWYAPCPKQGRTSYHFIRGGWDVPTARVQRGSSEAARCASTGIVPGHPAHFSTSC